MCLGPKLGFLIKIPPPPFGKFLATTLHERRIEDIDFPRTLMNFLKESF